MAKKLNELLQYINIETEDCREIECITYKIENVAQDSIFVALNRHDYDINNDVLLAKSKGAITISNKDADYIYQDCIYAYGILLEAFLDFPSNDLCVIGITGTNGKTTVSNYLFQLLSYLNKSCILIGTNGIYYKDIWEETVNTTPSQEVLAKWMLFAKQNKVEYIVMEVSSIGLHQKRLVGIQFDYVIVTGITHDHLDYHGSLLEYQLSKYQIFRHLKPNGVAILNTDDHLLRLWSSNLMMDYLEYNEHNIELIRMTIEYSLFVFQEYLIRTNIVAKCNVYNLCACICVLKHLRFSHKDITCACRLLPVVDGRFQMVHKEPCVIIDYAHTEDALCQILSFYQQYKKSRLIIVFGCGGDRDHTKRKNMGKVACDLADIVILTEDNSRSEKVEDIIAMIVQGCNGNEIIIYSREDAIKYALSIANNNDIIIIAGKGNERFIKNDVCKPASDFDVINRFYIGR